ncbi:MAG: phenylalanine--tRNA ligase subunit beta [Promethearchaeota archaeon]
MPSIELNLDYLEKILGKKVAYEQLQYDLQWISLDIDEYHPEENSIKVEFNPNRPDFSSPEGIARVLKGYYEMEIGLPKFKVTPSKEKFVVDSKVRKVRPYVVSGLVYFDHPLSEEEVVNLMHMQEILHWAIGRDRKKVAIGIHDYETVKGPYRYTTVKPDGVKFKPLHLEAYDLTPQEILEEHPMGIKYAPLLKGFDEYPIIYDAQGKVVSLPPIINGTYTTVTPNKTKILLLDLTGTQEKAVNDALNIIATTFADMGGDVQSVEVIYEDEPKNKIITPDLSEKSWTVHVDYINSYIGLNLTPDEMIHCFAKVRMEATKTKDLNVLKIKYPAYRTDIMHEVDFTEEVAMGYGYQNLPLSLNREGFGKYHPVQLCAQRTREIMIGAGGLEMINNVLASKNDFTRLFMEYNEEHNVILANPVSEEFNTVRQTLLSGLMRNLQNNRSAEKPFNLFEVGDVIILDPKSATHAHRELHLSAVVHSDTADYSAIKSIFDFYCRTMGIKDLITIKNESNPTYIEGRTGGIYYNKERIGYIGEIFPQVILNYGLSYPAAAFEINLKQIVKDLFE